MQARKLKPAQQRDEDFVKHLENVELFAEIKECAGALPALALILEMRVYAPGEDIIREGEIGSEMYLMIDGNASVFKSTAEGEAYKVAILESRHHVFFGEGGLLDSDARSATIKADSECTCLVLNRQAFEIFSAKFPQWALPILRRIARAVMARLKKTNIDLTLLYNALVAEIRGN